LANLILIYCSIEAMKMAGKYYMYSEYYGYYSMVNQSVCDVSFTVVHKTEVIKNTLNPTWQPFTIPVRSLCNGDHDRLLKIECYDWDKDGGYVFIL
jgi:hypothetical protein